MKVFYIQYANTAAFPPVIHGAHIFAENGWQVRLYTYHTPTASCLKGNLLRENGQVCDGIMDGPRCARCVLMAKGLVGGGAELLARSPRKFGGLIGGLGVSGRVATAVQMRSLVSGLLVDETQPTAWLAALRAMVTDPGILNRLRLGIRMPRHMKEVANGMTTLYEGLLNTGSRKSERRVDC